MNVAIKLKTIKGSVDVFNKGILGYLNMIAKIQAVYMNKKKDTILYYFGDIGKFKLQLLYNVAKSYTNQYQVVMKNKTFNNITRKFINLSLNDKKKIENSLKEQMSLDVIEDVKEIDTKIWRKIK